MFSGRHCVGDWVHVVRLIGRMRLSEIECLHGIDWIDT